MDSWGVRPSIPTYSIHGAHYGPKLSVYFGFGSMVIASAFITVWEHTYIIRSA